MATFVLAEADTPTERLRAARAGTVGFLASGGPLAQLVGLAVRHLAAVPRGPVTVLVVDADPAFGRLVAAALPAPAHHLGRLTAAGHCLAVLAESPPDVVLAGDCRLDPTDPDPTGPDRTDPDRTGAEVTGADLCRMIRSDPRWHQIPVIVATSRAGAPDAGSFEAGADDLVARSAVSVELPARLGAVLRRVHQPPGDATASAATVTDVDVVVVDDDDSVTDVIDYALRMRGLSSVRFDDGADAAARLCDGSLRTRLILLDVGLPGLDGFGVLDRLRAAGVLASTPVIVLTARSTEAETLAALDLGAAEHIAKPFSIPVLVSRVEHTRGAGRR